MYFKVYLLVLTSLLKTTIPKTVKGKLQFSADHLSVTLVCVCLGFPTGKDYLGTFRVLAAPTSKEYPLRCSTNTPQSCSQPKPKDNRIISNILGSVNRSQKDRNVDLMCENTIF